MLEASSFKSETNTYTLPLLLFKTPVELKARDTDIKVNKKY